MLTAATRLGPYEIVAPPGAGDRLLDDLRKDPRCAKVLEKKYLPQ